MLDTYLISKGMIELTEEEKERYLKERNAGLKRAIIGVVAEVVLVIASCFYFKHIETKLFMVASAIIVTIYYCVKFKNSVYVSLYHAWQNSKAVVDRKNEEGSEIYEYIAPVRGTSDKPIRHGSIPDLYKRFDFMQFQMHINTDINPREQDDIEAVKCTLKYFAKLEAYIRKSKDYHADKVLASSNELFRILMPYSSIEKFKEHGNIDQSVFAACNNIIDEMQKIYDAISVDDNIIIMPQKHDT